MILIVVAEGCGVVDEFTSCVMFTGPRNLVLQFTPLGGCYEWQTTADELREEFDVTTERKKKKQSREDEGQSEESRRAPCGTCWLRVSTEGEEDLDCLKALELYHEKNLELLEDNLPSFRSRMLDGDIILRKCMLEVEGGRHVPRAMFQSTAARESSLYLHVLLQTAVLDRFLSMLLEKPHDDRKEFLFPPLKSDLHGLARFFESFWNWPDTIRDTAEIVRNQVNSTSSSNVGNDQESVSNAVASLLVSTSNGYQQHKYLGVSFNLGLASLGLSALFISGRQGLNIGDAENLFSLLL